MRVTLHHTAVLLLLLSIAAVSSSAQFRRYTSEERQVLPSSTFDVVSGSVSVFRDSAVNLRPAKSPALATIFSSLVPGSGQIYAERYWTLPLIWGFGYWFVRQYIGSDRKYYEWRAKYSKSLTLGTYGSSGDAYAKYVRDFYHDQRDSFAFYLALTYVLNIVDAYVGASLYNFDVSEDLGGTSNVRFQLRLPLQ